MTTHAISAPAPPAAAGGGGGGGGNMGSPRGEGGVRRGGGDGWSDIVVSDRDDGLDTRVGARVDSKMLHEIPPDRCRSSERDVPSRGGSARIRTRSGGEVGRGDGS